MLHTVPELHKISNKAVARAGSVVVLTVFVYIAATIVVHDNIDQEDHQGVEDGGDAICRNELGNNVREIRGKLLTTQYKGRHN